MPGHSTSRRAAARPVAQSVLSSERYETSAKRSPAELAVLIKKLHSHIAKHPGVRFVTMNEMADDFAKRFPRKK